MGKVFLIVKQILFPFEYPSKSIHYLSIRVLKSRQEKRARIDDNINNNQNGIMMFTAKFSKRRHTSLNIRLCKSLVLLLEKEVFSYVLNLSRVPVDTVIEDFFPVKTENYRNPFILELKIHVSRTNNATPFSASRGVMSNSMPCWEVLYLNDMASNPRSGRMNNDEKWWKSKLHGDKANKRNKSDPNEGFDTKGKIEGEFINKLFSDNSGASLVQGKLDVEEIVSMESFFSSSDTFFAD